MTTPALRYWTMLLCLVASNAFAQVYTWTDSNGRTHYSDQPNSNNAPLTTIDIGTMPAPKIAPTATPRLLKGPLHALIVGQFGYGPNVLNAPEPVARLYFGSDCVSPQGLSFKQLREHAAKAIRTHEQLQVDAFRAIRKLGHTRLYRSGHYRDSAKDNHSALYLSAEVNQLTLTACAPNSQPSTDVATLSERQLKRFKQVNVWLQVHWQLRQRHTAKPLLSITTQGSAATQVDAKVNILTATRSSFLAATENALNNPELRKALTASAHSSRPKAQSSGRSLASQPQTKEVQKQYFAAALAELNTIQSRVAEYYQVRGVMPMSGKALGLAKAHIGDSRYINSVQIHASGVVHAELNPVLFSGAHSLQLTPVVSKGYTLLDWQCHTSVKFVAAQCGTPP